jgi:hypothetical protein
MVYKGMKFRTGDAMKETRFTKRFVGPVGTVLLVTALSWVAYTLAPRIPSFVLYQVAAIISGIVLFVGLWLGTLFVYPVTYLRGAGPAERIMGTLVTPLVWMTKEVVVVGSVYTLGEGLYFYLNPVNLLLLSAVVAEMGIADIFVRRRLKKGRKVRRIVTVPALAALVLGLGWFVFMFAWDLGVHHFYIFQEGFKALFGYGAGV